ncbi:MAG: hypothetical protein RLZZ618_3842 [Pseudomonadota bacterium]|jgi:hypothetical protein
MNPREFLFESVARQLDRSDASQQPVGRNYRCVCGRPIYFRNSQCLACGTPLGYEPHHSWLLPLAPGRDEGTWQAVGEIGDGAPRYRRCANFESAAGCNWLVDAPSGDAAAPWQPLCVACRLNRTIPDQTVEQNQNWWRRVEVAKRRLVSSLLLLGLPVKSLAEDPQRGLCFDLLSPAACAARVMTGHENGVITLNVEEADDVRREQVRNDLHEPYRTLLGHFRHEVGHYYWDRLVDNSPWLGEFRRLFGDEQLDYAAALQRNYEQGPPPDWTLHHVSAYASSHPWEDWAETWAHYLHMMDTLDTALGFGIDVEAAEQNYEVFTLAALYRPDDAGAVDFLGFVNAWVRMSGMMNELARSMGHNDLYPFVLPVEVVSKLHFIHMLVMEARAQGEPLEPHDASLQASLAPRALAAGDESMGVANAGDLAEASVAGEEDPGAGADMEGA